MGLDLTQAERNEKGTKTWQELTKQDSTIADSTGSACIVLLQKDIGKLEEDESYKVENMTVRNYQATRNLSVSKQSVITKIDNIGDTVDVDSIDEACNEANAVVGYIDVVLAIVLA